MNTIEREMLETSCSSLKASTIPDFEETHFHLIKYELVYPIQFHDRIAGKIS